MYNEYPLETAIIVRSVMFVNFVFYKYTIQGLQASSEEKLKFVHITVEGKNIQCVRKFLLSI